MFQHSDDGDSLEFSTSMKVKAQSLNALKTEIGRFLDIKQIKIYGEEAENGGLGGWLSQSC